jgi:PAS domain S-box-containing protein
LADPTQTVAYLIAIELPFIVSFFLWYGQGVTQGETDTLPSEVGTQDISQGMLISSIAEGVTVIDDQFRVQVFNPAAAETTGWSETDARGIDYRSVLQLTDDDGNQLPTNEDPIQRVFAKAETIVDNDVKLRTRNNKDIDLTFVASPITSANGSTVAVVAVFRDVSEERNQERQRAEFISTASHEMRTPVAAIEGYLALAMNESVSKIDSKARGYLDKAHSSTQHLGKLFQDLLTAAKSEDGRLQNNQVVTEMGTFIDELVDGMRFTAEKKGLILEYADNNAVAGEQSVRPLYYAHVDPERMSEVVTNLFDNAVKYTSEGKITVSLQGDDQNIVISVADTGPGIPQEDIPHLFQKFYRVDNTATRQIGGTGLGLFIARKIVEINGGKIWVESVVDTGSTFRISLPRLSAAQAETMKKQEAAAQTPLANVTANVDI